MIILKKFQFKALDIDTINIIASWVYKEPGAGIYMKPYQESHLETPDDLKGPGGCDWYGVYLDNELFGLFEFTFKEGVLEIGCAIAPAFKGQGFGADFVQVGIEFGVSEYNYAG